MNSYSCLSSFSFSFSSADTSSFDHGYDETFGGFSIMVGNDMVVSVINECETPRTKGLGWDESCVVLSAELVDSIPVDELVVENGFSLANNVYVSAFDRSV